MSLAEIASAVAVVISLFYPANEFRRSQTLTSTDVESLLYERMLEMDRLLIESLDLAEIVTRAASEAGELSPVDRARLRPAYGWEGNRRNHMDDFIQYVESQLQGE